MPMLSELLQQFHQAQQNVYGYLGISRQLQHRVTSEVSILRYKQIGGNEEIPNAYPEILDYRGREWRRVLNETNADDEIHIKIWSAEDWSMLNTIRFNILTVWADEEGEIICIVCNHLPKVYELFFPRTYAVEQVEKGVNFYGDTCVLLLTAK
jgi:hypothetical protein